MHQPAVLITVADARDGACSSSTLRERRGNSAGYLHKNRANGEIFYTLKEAQVLIEEWRLEYNTFRPHSSLKYRPPAPEAWLH
jgi:transposase InsO family protein